MLADAAARRGDEAGAGGDEAGVGAAGASSAGAAQTWHRLREPRLVNSHRSHVQHVAVMDVICARRRRTAQARAVRAARLVCFRLGEMAALRATCNELSITKVQNAGKREARVVHRRHGSKRILRTV